MINLHLHSDSSLLDAISKPHQIVERCIEIGSSACALTDHGTISNNISFHKEMREKKLKPILGCELYICQDDPTIKSIENKELSHLVVLAKNKEGWKDLIKITSQSNHPDFFYYKPRMNLDNIKKILRGNQNLISFSGHPGSELANIFFEDYKIAYGLNNIEECKKLIRGDWVNVLRGKIAEYQGIFGEANFFLEIQLIDKDNLPASILIAEGLRYLSKKYKIDRVCTGDAHYCRKEDAEDQRVLLSNKLNMSLKQIYKKIKDGDNFSLSSFFKSPSYYILDKDDGVALYDEEEIANTYKIAEMCEEYEVMREPQLPSFDYPKEFTSSQKYLQKLCYDGFSKFKNKINKVIKDENNPYTRSTYVERYNKEIEVLDKFNLSDYFLIVHDIIQWARKNNIYVGAGRGSAAGSLILYLLEVTYVDPIKYNLLFERFLNEGRLSGDWISLPDVDMDFEISARGKIITYMKERFGSQNVSQMCTFSTMKGRSALKDVLRAHEACSFEQMNIMTHNIPDEAEISDQLQLMKEKEKEGGESPSIILWALQNRVEEFKEWVHIDEGGNLQGAYAKLFEQAIRIEGTKRNQSKHPAGVIISMENLLENCPMIYDKSTGEMIAGLTMGDLEDMGYVKFDILGVAVLDKIHGIVNLLKMGKLDYE